MESVSKKTGKVFTGKFAEIAVKIGIADEAGEEKKVQAPKVQKVQKAQKAKPGRKSKK